MAEQKLTRLETFQLINIYKSNECLWNTKSANYRRLDLKKRAWEQIEQEMHYSQDFLKKKFKSLRSAYVSEMKKVTQSKKSGNGFEDVHVPGLFYFEEMQFLEATITLRKCTDNLDTTLECVESFCEIVECSEETPPAGVGETASVCSSSRTVTAKRRLGDKYDDAISKILESSKAENDDAFAAFGRSVGLQLKEMEIKKAYTTMGEIQNLITTRICEETYIRPWTISNTPSQSQLRSNIIAESLREAEVVSSDYTFYN